MQSFKKIAKNTGLVALAAGLSVALAGCIFVGKDAPENSPTPPVENPIGTPDPSILPSDDPLYDPTDDDGVDFSPSPDTPTANPTAAPVDPEVREGLTYFETSEDFVNAWAAKNGACDVVNHSSDDDAIGSGNPLIDAGSLSGCVQFPAGGFESIDEVENSEMVMLVALVLADGEDFQKLDKEMPVMANAILEEGEGDLSKVIFGGNWMVAVSDAVDTDALVKDFGALKAFTADEV